MRTSKKMVLLLLFSILLLNFLLRVVPASSSLLVSGSNFDIKCLAGHMVGFQSTHTLYLKIRSGFLNGTSSNLQLYSMRGYLQFNAQNYCLFNITTDTEEGVDVEVAGASSVSHSGFQWTVSISSGQTIQIRWAWRIENYLDKYFTLGMGLGGLLLMCFSPTWVCLHIRKKGLEVEGVEKIGYAMLLFFIGLAMFFMWLWS